ncbi:chloride channel [Seminavis robusta]|uniref:Chloride channel n=1 Tax=Seminavis robusta TaxID=568900 RepID=A0A9N8DW98_9STRA|nr:chloride channel [Seminavis robusta]|eukprot:Sro423_g139820.1 chloride channel (1348) ;mRNA; f:38099-42674
MASKQNDLPFAGGGISADPETGIPPPSPPAQRPVRRKTSKQIREESQARRVRTASDGSTFGAFFQNQELVGSALSHHHNPHGEHGQQGPRRRRSARRPKDGSPPKQPPKTSGTGSDLGDVASMAIAGLGIDVDMNELMGGGTSPLTAKPKTSRRGLSPPGTAGRKTSQLETIPDDSEHHGYVPRPGEQLDHSAGRQTSFMRSSIMTTDSLRISEGSADLEEDVAGMLSQIDRDNSLFLSELSDGGFANLVRGGPEPAGRQSLLGSSILDKQSSGSLYNQGKRQSLLGSAILDKQSSASLYNQGSAGGKPTHAKKVSGQSDNSSQQHQQQEIASFAAMLHNADYGAVSTSDSGAHPLKFDSGPLPVAKDPDPVAARHTLPYSSTPPAKERFEDEPEEESEADERYSIFDLIDPTDWLVRWLTKDAKVSPDGARYFDESAEYTIAGLVRWLFFNPYYPEFSSLQQHTWAVVLGILMGLYTAFWKEIIEHSVEFMWKELPEALLEWGVFTELDGSFPLYHYMWICPSIWAGILSYIFAALPTPIPGQNEWITAVHLMGVQDSETFFQLFVLSTLGMASGLSLGPELPLVLTAGMIGSWLGIRCKQSILQARTMNITCASAAVGGFFGFPMAGALFVLEIPHRMGLQYFEALSPATIASIVAVLCNRLVTGNDVTGYYNYPFLTTSLPSEIFSSAIVFGLFGAFVGTIYARSVLKLKGLVHDFFHEHHDDHGNAAHDEHTFNQPDGKGNSVPHHDEKTPLMNGNTVKTTKSAPPTLALHRRIAEKAQKYFCCVIPHEPTRAAAAGVVAGAMVGVICMFVPHVMFWGEAQLQTLIDKGRTPLPVFGQEDEPTAALTAKAFCLIDPNDAEAVKAGFGMGCSLLITMAKIVVTGLSLGTGIIGGHFWGPLFSGCAASHFLTDVNLWLSDRIGFGATLAAYPCVTILCTMGSTHVVTFRAHTAIMLILTLTISAFDPEDASAGGTGGGGDYSAVFPLLVVSVFVSLLVSRRTVFYKAQRSRVDIMALPEVLCEPGKEGMPMVMVDYASEEDFYDGDSYDEDGDYMSEDDLDSPKEAATTGAHPLLRQADDSRGHVDLASNTSPIAKPTAAAPEPIATADYTTSRREREISTESTQSARSRGSSPLPPRPLDRKKTSSGDLNSVKEDSSKPNSVNWDAGLDALLSTPLESEDEIKKKKHRRIRSAPNVDFGKRFQRDRAAVKPGQSDKSLGDTGSTSARHARSDSYGSQSRVMRVATIGQLSVDHPDLLEQARMMSSTSAISVESRHVRHPSMPSRFPRGDRLRSHSRGDSLSSIGAASTGPPLHVAVDRQGVPAADIERAFASAVNRELVGKKQG